MEFKEGYEYSKSHEWVKEKDGGVLIGITDYAQDALGDIVFANLPEIGDTVAKGVPFGDVESVKAVSDIYSPVSGKVVAVNEEIIDSPEKMNSAPYDAWLIEVGEVSDKEALMSAAEYKEFCEKEAK
jgi:glycine cleavage system H protein